MTHPTTSHMIHPTTADKVAEALHDGYQLTDKDQMQLALKDEEYKLQTWEDLALIIAENRLEDLKRVPSDLKRYIAWSHKTRLEYGSIQAFILKERLGWTDLKHKNPTPYAHPDDTKVLINDWPYGNAPGILHLVCWTKAPIPTQPGDGDLTPESRAIIEKFVRDTFVQRLGEDNVLWFKNWASIQSVRSVEHIHVLIRNYSEEFIKSVVGIDARDQVKKTIGELVKEEEEEEEREANVERAAEMEREAEMEKQAEMREAEMREAEMREAEMEKQAEMERKAEMEREAEMEKQAEMEREVEMEKQAEMVKQAEMEREAEELEKAAEEMEKAAQKFEAENLN